MRALVTGATGFLGSHLTRELVRQGHDVRVLVRSSSDLRRLAGVTVDLAEGDVTDAAAVGRAAEGVDTVFHAAAQYVFGPPNPDRMRAINVLGTANVLSGAKAGGAVVVYVSSASAMGATGSTPEDESFSAGTPPRSQYERTKREALDLARRAAIAGDRVRIALPGTIYGPDDTSVMGQIVRTSGRLRLLVGFNRGIVISPVHVDDVVDGLLRMAEQGRDGTDYVLAAQNVDGVEWFAALNAAAGHGRVLVLLPDRAIPACGHAVASMLDALGLRGTKVRELTDMAVAQWSYSGEKARRELGWSPRPLDEGLQTTIAWYRNAGRVRQAPA